jgi:hypothetical protein
MTGTSATLWRSIRGPILLVTLGTLFMADYSGGVSFGRTWPVLLIVLGVLRLGEHLSSRNA